MLTEFCDAADDTPTPPPAAPDTDDTEFVTFGVTELLPETLGATAVPFTIFAGATLDKLLMEELLRLVLFVTGGGDNTELVRPNTWC